MKRKYFKRPPPVEYMGIHLPDGCGCYPFDYFVQHVGWQYDKRGRRIKLVWEHRICLS